MKDIYIVVCAQVKDYAMVSYEILEAFGSAEAANSHMEHLAKDKCYELRDKRLAEYRLPYVKDIEPYVVEANGVYGLGEFTVGTKNILRNGEETYNDEEFVYYVKRIDFKE